MVAARFLQSVERTTPLVDLTPPFFYSSISRQQSKTASRSPSPVLVSLEHTGSIDRVSSRYNFERAERKRKKEGEGGVDSIRGSLIRGRLNIPAEVKPKWSEARRREEEREREEGREGGVEEAFGWQSVGQGGESHSTSWPKASSSEEQSFPLRLTRSATRVHPAFVSRSWANRGVDLTRHFTVEKERTASAWKRRCTVYTGSPPLLRRVTIHDRNRIVEAFESDRERGGE